MPWGRALWTWLWKTILYPVRLVWHVLYFLSPIKFVYDCQDTSTVSDKYDSAGYKKADEEGLDDSVWQYLSGAPKHKKGEAKGSWCFFFWRSGEATSFFKGLFGIGLLTAGVLIMLKLFTGVFGDAGVNMNFEMAMGQNGELGIPNLVEFRNFAMIGKYGCMFSYVWYYVAAGVIGASFAGSGLLQSSWLNTDERECGTCEGSGFALGGPEKCYACDGKGRINAPKFIKAKPKINVHFLGDDMNAPQEDVYTSMPHKKGYIHKQGTAGWGYYLDKKNPLMERIPVETDPRGYGERIKESIGNIPNSIKGWWTEKKRGWFGNRDGECRLSSTWKKWKRWLIAFSIQVGFGMLMLAVLKNVWYVMLIDAGLVAVLSGYFWMANYGKNWGKTEMEIDSYEQAVGVTALAQGGALPVGADAGRIDRRIEYILQESPVNMPPPFLPPPGHGIPEADEDERAAVLETSEESETSEERLKRYGGVHWRTGNAMYDSQTYNQKGIRYNRRLLERLNAAEKQSHHVQ